MRIFSRDNLPPILVTSRLTLREVDIKDVSEDLLRWLNDPQITQYLEIRHVPQTRERVYDYVRSRLMMPENPHFGVYDKGGERLIGTTTVNMYNEMHKTADISFVIGHSEAGGRGYATEAVHAVCAYLFHVTGLEKVTGGLYKENIGSRRVFEKNAFTLEGERRSQYVSMDGNRTDALMYGLLAVEFVPDFTLLGGERIEISPFAVSSCNA